MSNFRVPRTAIVACAVLFGAVADAAEREGGGFLLISAVALTESASGRAQPNECDVMVQLLNKHQHIVDSLTLDMAVFLKGSPRPEIRTVYFGSITPAQKQVRLITLSHRCPDVSRIVLRDASNCRIARERRSDCLARIETVSETQIPVEK